MELYLRKPQSIIQDKRLTSVEADYLCLIAQLHNAKGCTASNLYFADYFGIVRNNAARTISALKRKGFIATNEKKAGGKTIERTITIIDADSINLLLSKNSDSIETIPSDSINSASGIVSDARTLHKRVHKKTHKSIARTPKTFTPPSLKAVQEYITDKKFIVDAAYFLEYYTEAGWTDKNGEPVNWKLKLISWNRREEKDKDNGQSFSKRSRRRVVENFDQLESEYGITIEA